MEARCEQCGKIVEGSIEAMETVFCGTPCVKKMRDSLIEYLFAFKGDVPKAGFPAFAERYCASLTNLLEK